MDPLWEVNKRMKKLLVLLVSLVSLASWSQDAWVRRGGCMPDVEAADGTALRVSAQHRLPAINTDWDMTKVYRQLVILISYTDTDFSMENPLDTYQRIFNEQGYNQRQGPGCVADYFSSQSGGMLNLQFDVYGPYKVNSLAQPYDNPTENIKNTGTSVLREAAQMFLAEHADMDFSPYDWNGDKKIEQVIYIYAGYTGNQNSTKSFGHIWPNTSSFSTLTTNSGHQISNYSASAELWTNNALCGIGTICHEFSHSLGLPDIYPTGNSSWTYSVVDEWDLMDGGNFTNYGWCPPNYTALERYLMGWLDFEELTQPTTIIDLKPISEGGKAYVVKHTDNEYLLLENRQWIGWDAGLPGKGLVAYHVNYVPSRWKGNTPNNVSNKPNFSLMDPSKMSYENWVEYLTQMGVTTQSAVYQNSTYRLNSKIMSNAAYPANGDEQTMIDSLTNTSPVATEMYNQNIEGSLLLSKPITNIRVSDDGLVSFDFMGGSTPTGISQVATVPGSGETMVFDLNGRRLCSDVAAQKGIRLVRLADGTVRKLFSK